MVDANTFPGKRSDEKIVLVMHRHWFTFVAHLLLILALMLLPIVIAILWTYAFEWQLTNDSLGYAVVVMCISLYALFVWNLLYHFWLDFSLDYYVISDQRVIDVEQAGLFHRTVAEQDIDRIQDCTSETHGFFPTLLKYGNVYIQTAGEKQRFIFEDIPNPEQVVKIIFQYAELNRASDQSTKPTA
jgi:uncharacterized membrane protein YdbT with pleckstrin-like domain